DLAPGESRSGALIVWRGEPEGMVGVVVRDDNDPSGSVDLAKIQLVFPGVDGCGVLKIRDGVTVAASLKTTEAARNVPRFLTLIRPTLFWNYWIEDADDTSVEQPSTLQTE